MGVTELIGFTREAEIVHPKQLYLFIFFEFSAKVQ